MNNDGNKATRPRGYTWEEAKDALPSLEDAVRPQEKYIGQRYPLDTWKEYYATIVEEYEAQAPCEAVFPPEAVSGPLEEVK